MTFERRRRGLLGWIAVTLLLLWQVLMLTQVLDNLSAFQGAARTGGYLHVMLASSLAGTLGIVLLVAIWIAGTILLAALAYVTRGARG